ncbi:hypothetical protein ACGF5O_16335 [Streptomyces sp. NPDC048291]|uniref:hypothetical protein n=1 Tax=Streptomyces sp. NPDC048291 TaxID=3365530 RepID=UPI003711C2E0
MAITGWREELDELLVRAGLELVADPCVEEVVPPAVAWRHVIGWEAEPTAEVALDRPERVAELNAHWHRSASEAGLLDGDGVFLLAFHGNARSRWTRVRLAQPGHPERPAAPAAEGVLLRDVRRRAGTLPRSTRDCRPQSGAARTGRAPDGGGNGHGRTRHGVSRAIRSVVVVGDAPLSGVP